MLLLTFIILLTLTTISVAFLYMTSIQLKASAADIASRQALWLAEAGLNKAIWYLLDTAPDDTHDGSWRTDDYPEESGSDPPVQESLVEGTYMMWVQDSGSDVKIYARGTASGLSRTITQAVEVTSSGGVEVTPQNDWNEF